MQAVMTNEGLDFTAFAFIFDADGTPYVYDINTNTNYKSDVEVPAGVSAMCLFTDHLSAELATVTGLGLKVAS